jgi:excisionase family DNA binding protein
MDELLTIPELAAKMKVQTCTVRSWVNKKTIPFIKLPQGIRFKPEVVESWLNKRTIKAKSL